MTLTTKRLTLRTLNLEELELLLIGPDPWAAATGLVWDGEPLDRDFRSFLEDQRQLLTQNPAQAPYNTVWLMLAGDRVLGSCGFKGPPDAAGEVEIGYGIHQLHEGRGYTTEAVAALCAWALAQPPVTAVLAETEQWNLASQRVLEKCGMTRDRETPTAFWWRLQRQPRP